MSREGLQHVDEAVGVRIREMRIKRGMSQTDLGKLLGVTFQQIQKYEAGTNSIALARLPDLCAALKCSPNDLAGYKDKSNDRAFARVSSYAMKIAIHIHGMPVRRRSRLVSLIEDISEVQLGSA